MRAIPGGPLSSVAALSSPKPWAPGEGAQKPGHLGGLPSRGAGEQQRMGPGQAREQMHIWRADAKASGSWQLVR